VQHKATVCKLLNGRFRLLAPQERLVTPFEVKSDVEERTMGRVDSLFLHGPLLHAKFYPHRCRDGTSTGPDTPKMLRKFFYQILEYKRPYGVSFARSLRICRVYVICAWRPWKVLTNAANRDSL